MPGDVARGGIDGDGQYDSIQYGKGIKDGTTVIGYSVPRLNVAAGLQYLGTWTNAFYAAPTNDPIRPYPQAAVDFLPKPGEITASNYYLSYMNLADVNADGLANLIVTRPKAPVEDGCPGSASSAWWGNC